MPIVSGVGIAVGNNLGGNQERADQLQAKMEETVRICQARGISDEVMQEMLRKVRERFSQEPE